MRIEVAGGIEGRLRKALRSAGRREIGGMLFAEQISSGHFRIIDFSLDLFSGSHANFRRDPDVHRKMLDAFFEKTGNEFSRFNYLGEWHSHPSFSVRPSPEDLATMTELVSDRTNITFAVLLVVSLKFGFWLDHSWTLFSHGDASRRLRLSPRFI